MTLKQLCFLSGVMQEMINLKPDSHCLLSKYCSPFYVPVTGCLNTPIMLLCKHWK